MALRRSPVTSAQEYVAFDLETTGLTITSDQIIEIGAVRFDLEHAEPIGTFSTFVNPRRPIPLAVQRLTGITDSDLEGAPLAHEALEGFSRFAAGAHIVAHAAPFDVGFCNAQTPDFFEGSLILDTLELARLFLPAQAGHSLGALVAALGIEHTSPHRALSDADATRQLLLHLQQVCRQLPHETLVRLRSLAAQLPEPAASYFLDRDRVGDGTDQPAVCLVPAEEPQAAVPAPEVTSPEDLVEATKAMLGPGGSFAAASDYEFRPSQEQMAIAVAQVIARGERAIIEAGPGTGKSYAYLIPVTLAASTSRRAVVATHTLTLQDQLAERDLPALAKRLGRPLDYASLKGRSHYVSLRRWTRYCDRSLSGLDEVRFRMKVATWLASTRTGARGEITLSREEARFWSHIESRTDDCLSSRCQNFGNGSCRMYRARQRAAVAPLVITNHAMLFAAPESTMAPFGNCDTVVIDEAHHLEDTVTSQLSETLATGTISALGQIAELPEAALAELAAAERTYGHLMAEVKGFLTVRTAGQPQNSSITISNELRADPAFLRLVKTCKETVLGLAAAAAGISRLIDQAGSAEPAGPPTGKYLWGTEAPTALLPVVEPMASPAELSLIVSGLSRCAAVLEQCFTGARDGYVAWLELHSQQPEIHEAPVEIGGLFSEKLPDEVSSLVLTSATLAIHGSFSYFRERLGLKGTFQELILASPFDFLRQSIMVLPTGMGGYDAPGFAEEMAALLSGAASTLGGRTMALFTSFSSLKATYNALGNRLEEEGIALLGQSIDGTRTQILRSFLADPRSLILGTMSFWEGVDLPGDALRCVVIAKLPFAVPDDPVLAARGALLSDPFRQLSLPRAILTLRQGFGRLIRTSVDVGAVVLCDPRLTTKSYGKLFIEALPPASIHEVPYQKVGELLADTWPAPILKVGNHEDQQ